MPIVNYVREHIRFMEYACDEKLTSSERLLWYALMHIMNQRAQGNVWPEDFVRISNERLLSLCPMKFDSMANARNSLKQRGLIEVEKGDKNKKSPAYRMIYFFPTYASPTTEKDGTSYPEISDNTGYNMGGNMGYNMGGNMGGNEGGSPGDIYINNKPGLIPSANRIREDDDENGNIISHSRARIAQAWKIAFGRDTNPAMLDAIVQRGLIVCRFDPNVVCTAVKLAALRGADSPLDYIFQLFRDWTMHNIRTVGDLDLYLEGDEA